MGLQFWKGNPNPTDAMPFFYSNSDRLGSFFATIYIVS